MSDTPDIINDTNVTRDFWDAFYSAYSRPALGPPNRLLVTEVEPLPPGTALDLGCGQGSDTIWLAEHGWHVTAVDVSAAALERLRTHAERLHLTDRITVEAHELATSFPAGEFDLVSAQFLHSPVAAGGERARILRRAAAAVAPGGHLLIVSHQSMPAWHQGMPAGLTEHPLTLTVPTAEENLAALHVNDTDWDTLRSETVAFEMTGPDGQTGTREDQVLHSNDAGPPE